MMIVVTFLAHLSEQITEAYIALANYGKKWNTDASDICWTST